MSPGTALTRRTFLQAFGGGLAVLWTVGRHGLHAQAESGGAGRSSRSGNRRPADIAAWLHIAADGSLTLFSGKTEVGQNVRTLITQALAEELPAPLSQIKVVLADTSLVPWDAGTFGSRSAPDMFPQIRRVGATAREALIDLAAKQWNVERATLSAAAGRIVEAGGSHSIGYGELTRGEKLVLTIADSMRLKPAADWTVAGTSVPRIDGRADVTGAHLYTTDVRRPGLLHGRVLRPTAFGATLANVDASAAEAIAGVQVVRDGEFIGVVAPTEHLAGQALAAIRADWKTSPQVSERELFPHLRSTARNAPPPATAETHTYNVAYIAHAPLEPRAAVAEWADGRLTVWTGTQRPFGVRSDLAAALKVPEEHIRVIVPDTGSGYGGKHTGEAAIEAARLARRAGQPVKLVWTREEEFTWAYFRPAGVIEMVSAADAGGRITRWDHRNFNSGGAAIRALYDVPASARVEQAYAAQTPLRQGSYRGLAPPRTTLPGKWKSTTSRRE